MPKRGGGWHAADRAKRRRPPEPFRTPSGRLTEEAKAWFYEEVRVSGRSPFKIGEQAGMSRSLVRQLLTKVSRQWADGHQLSPGEIAKRMYQGAGPGGGVEISNQDFSDLDEDQIRSRLTTNTKLLAEIPDPITKFEDLNSAAQQAYKEFGYWRRRYLGRRNIQWQIEMCLLIMNWLAEARKYNERVRGVVNTPPGGGKTTTITHDFPGWAICRERNIRCGLGSRTTPQANAYSRRLRNTLERNVLLNVDFGRFKPEVTEVWRQDEFIVDGVTGSEASIEFRLALAGFDYEDPHIKSRLADESDSIHEVLKAIESVFVAGEKEPTVKALSYQMGFLGGRFDLNLWDDLVDNKNSRDPELRNSLAEWWEEYAVSRAEPGGVIVLTGTRFGKYDLFRYCRDMVYTTDEDLETMLLDRVTTGMTDDQIDELREDLAKEIYDSSTKAEQADGTGLNTVATLTPDEDGIIDTKRMRHHVYRYVKYPAHNEALCLENGTITSMKSVDHRDCLLDPVRFRWHDLLRAREANPRKFAITYQQEDESTEDNLIQEVWLTGGVDDENISYPGCYNYSRSLLDMPSHLEEVADTGDEVYIPKQDCYSIATVDPSATNFWSVQWWIWDERTDTDYLIDILRARLTSDSFLSYSTTKREYHGIMEQWQQRAKDMGWPIGLWIIEQNAAQRYLFQHTWVNEWQKENRTHIKGHESGPQKADPEYGVQVLRPRYRQGRVDLPYKQEDLRTRAAINEFKQELVEWPDSPTDDMVNGHWFLEANRYKIPKGLKVSVSHARVRHPFQDSMPQHMIEQTTRDRTPRAQGHARSRHRPH